VAILIQKGKKMNAPVASIASSLKVNQIFIQGRIEHVTKFNDNFEHIIITPAPDAYSKPSLMRVNASTRLGQKEEDVKVLCYFNGWSNNYKNKDGDPVRDVKGFFIAVE
jgi:hypothetical protein